MNELIQQARKCAVCMIGADECHRESCKVDNCADVIDLLADALEAAQKEIERLNVALTLSKAREHPADIFPELTPQQRAENAEIVALTARAEKVEAERDTYKAALQNWHEAGETP